MATARPHLRKYALVRRNQPGNNLATNANFSGGNTNFSSGYTFSNSSPLQPGQYWVGANPSQINPGFTSCGDHTTGSGNMLVVNGGASTSTPIWCQTYTVVPNSTYIFETWVASLTSASPANVMLFVNNISQNAGFFASGTSCNWEKYCVLWTSGVQTSVTLCLYDLNVANTGNDFALDDISFRRCVSPFGYISGRVYETCETVPYTDQPVLPGWTIQLLDETETTVLAEHQWCSGESTQTLDLMLPCGEHDFCVSVTCSDGSVASDAITVVVTDNIPPTIVCPQNVQFDCFSPTTPSATGFASATDNCNVPLVTFTDVVTGSQPCNQLIVRTWKAEDWCNNISTCVQTIMVMDNIAPVINCPQDMTFTAFDPNCDMPVFGIHSLGATDNCGTPAVTYAITGATTASGSGDASGTTFSPGTSTVTYTATDLCNNTSSCSFDVTIDCDTCACLGFQNMEFYNFLSGPNLPALCDSTTVMLPCIGSDALYWFQWGLLCSDPLCQQSYSYSIVPASGGPALVSGTVPLGSPPFLNFSYNQLSGPGNYQIILTGHCGTDSCVCHINFSVPNCCECGGFSDMTYRPTQGIMNLSYTCGDTLGVVCDQVFEPQFGGIFQCVGQSCPAGNTIQWVLRDPAGNPIQSGPASANPGFNFTLMPSWFNQPGIYSLTFMGQCGGVACDNCVLYLESLGCQGSCCAFSDLFVRGPQGALSQPVTCDGPPLNIGCPAPGSSYTLTGKFGSGPTIQAIMVDACAVEENNEFLILHSGAIGFNINDLQVDFDAFSNTGGSQNNDLNINAAACGWQNGQPGMFTGCPNVIVAGPGTFIPADAYLVIQTSSSASSSGIYDFTNLCNAAQPVYLISNACARTTGAFRNGPLAGTHTTIISVDGTCVDSATYLLPQISGANGAYFLPPATYGNAGCFAPSYTQFTNNPSNLINWTLTGPGSPQNGQIVGANPYFALSLPSSYFSQGGLYTLTLDGQHESDSCQCTLSFLVDNNCPDPCPCDLVDLNNDVSQGFATAYSTTSCKACFTPLALTDCDEVEWYVNQPFGQPVGTSMGNQTFCHTFPVGGTYTVFMSVIRRRSDGSFCESSTKARPSPSLVWPGPSATSPLSPIPILTKAPWRAASSKAE
ncbi:MAG: HYR domain-containing protein [Saprospiraceae bacterium]|nr:HYR domain-containing protein [Saprospiraceae bacterium]